MSNSLEGGGVYMCLGGGEGAVALESNREVACHWFWATKLLIDTCTIARQKTAESLRIKDQWSRCWQNLDSLKLIDWSIDRSIEWLSEDWLIDCVTDFLFIFCLLASNTTKPKTDAKKAKQGKESKTEGKDGDKPQGEKEKDESKPKDDEKKPTEKSEKPKETKEKQDKDDKKDSDTEEPLPLPSAEEASSNEPAGSSSSPADSSKGNEQSSDSSSKKQANDELW